MSLLDNLPHRCRIQRIARTADGLGGNRDTPVIVIADIECWEQQASSSEMMLFEKRGMSISRKVYFTTKPNVTERMEIVVTSRQGVAVEEADEIRLTVMSEPRPDASAGLGLLWKVMVNEQTAE